VLHEVYVVSTVASARPDRDAWRLAQLHEQLRVLVVEDDCIIASSISDELIEFGFAVIGPADNLTDAIAMAASSFLDCALIDIALGGESALPVAQILMDRNIPFAFVTGETESAEGTFQDVPVLLKPFTVEELRLALERILSS
jgi:DNA-binding response OmpR family regulator